MTRAIHRSFGILLAILAVAGLCRLRLDTDVLRLLPDAVPEVHGLRMYQSHFVRSRELLITIRGSEPEGVETATRLLAETLERKPGLVSSLNWLPPWQQHPEQMAEIIACLWLNQPVAMFDELATKLAPDKLDILLQRARDDLTTSLSPATLGRLGYDPFGIAQSLESSLRGSSVLSDDADWFVSSDGNLRVLYVEAPESSIGRHALSDWLHEVQREVVRCSEQQGWPQSIKVRYTGTPAFTTEIAARMESDLKGSITLTVVCILALFWGAHRVWTPLVWLVLLLGLILLGALGIGGIIWGEINVISLGFAAILLGLGVDYGLILYQELIAEPTLSTDQVRERLRPGILWSAVTTAAAFGLLPLLEVPGLSQLGTLVGAGIILAAWVMLYGFLPLLAKFRSSADMKASHGGVETAVSTGLPWRTLIIVTVGIIAGAGMVLSRGITVDHGTAVLQPRNCDAQEALDELDKAMNGQGPHLLLVMTGHDTQETADRLDRVQGELLKARSEHAIRGFSLPTGLWPHETRSQTNLLRAQGLYTNLNTMRAASDRAGFRPEAMAFTEKVLNYWNGWAGGRQSIWPTNESARWILRRAAAYTPEGYIAAGAIDSNPGQSLPAVIEQLHTQDTRTWVTGWPRLVDSLIVYGRQRFAGLVIAMICLVTVCLWLAFRSWKQVLLSLGTLAFSFLVLLAIMAAIGAHWNLMSLMAIPLMLGAGVDYTIHVQLAMQRSGGNTGEMRRVTGKALFLCAATTVIGFASNGFSSQQGLASLGLASATGISIVYLSSIYLLPDLWILALRKDIPFKSEVSTPSIPALPAVYNARMWQLGCKIAGQLNPAVCERIGILSLSLYRLISHRQRKVVEANLLQVCGNNQRMASKITRRLYANFGRKLAQLLLLESGQANRNSVARWSGWNHLKDALETRSGVLLVTPHLGNWEQGGYLLANSGVQLLVVTQPEPGQPLTDLRQEARAKHGIRTLVVGRDPFAFVEIIKQLANGGVVALLIDRPSETSSIRVELFGAPFDASIAVAELARASGCVVLPVYVISNDSGTEAHILPKVIYERRELGNRAARIEMTQQIVRTFEPIIQRHADQWYHFVPIWPARSNKT